MRRITEVNGSKDAVMFGTGQDWAPVVINKRPPTGKRKYRVLFEQDDKPVRKEMCLITLSPPPSLPNSRAFVETDYVAWFRSGLRGDNANWALGWFGK